MANTNDRAVVVAEIKSTVEQRVSASLPLLGRLGVSEQEMVRIILNAFNVGPDITHCTQQSIDNALLQAIEMGLMPDTREGVIIPFKRQATFVPMVEGRLKVARKATPGLSIRARVVYSEDEWEYREGIDFTLHHVPKAVDKRDEKVIAGYAVATWPVPGQPGERSTEYVVLRRPDIERARARAMDPDGGAWVDFFPEQVETACVKALLKRLPKKPGQYEPPAAVADWQPGMRIPGDDAEPEPERDRAPRAPQRQGRRRPPEPPAEEEAPPPDDEPTVESPF